MYLKLISYLSIGLFFNACSPKTNVVLLESDKAYNSVIIFTDKGSVQLDKEGDFVSLHKNEVPSRIKFMSKAERENHYAILFKALPKKPKAYTLYFKANSTELTQDSINIFKKALRKIEERSPCIVDIIGHTDTVGSNEINQRVSLKRAKYVKDMILHTEIQYRKPEIEDIDAQTISLITKGYGEEDLLVETLDNVPEEKNRNVEIFIK